jgi:hypothetical protein
VGGKAGVYVGVYADRVFSGGGEGKMSVRRVYSLECSRSAGKIQAGSRWLFNRLAGTVYSAIVLLALFTVHCSLYTAFAQPVSSSELINNAKQYDGQVVLYEGEAVGDVMVRGEFAWVNLNDGENAVGIWLTKDLAQAVAFTASYKSKGDWLEVTGVFHRACLQHGGDLDIHAQSVKKTSSGRRVEERLNPAKRIFALALLGLLGGVWILTRLMRK